jgi:hypothetical protein
MRSRAICTHTTYSPWVSVVNAVFQRLDSRRKDFKDGRTFCLTIAEVNVGLKAVQLDQLPVIDSLKPMQDESVCNANRENDASPLISYIDNQIMPQSDCGNQSCSRKPGQESASSEPDKLAQDT